MHFLATSFSRVAFGVLALFLITALGTGGYVVIEGWSLLDAFYMTVITITTVGYSETRPLDDVGRIYTIGLILSGVGTAFYILTALVSTIIEGDLQQVFGERRVRTRISELSGHHIVCGYGRVGQEVVLELTLRHANFIVVDSDLAPLERAQKEGYLTLHGDATEEATLLEAGLERCNSLIAAADSDSGNTYITLTAKSLRPDVFVVARVGSAANEGKLRQAGADRVVSPYQMGGRRIALAALQPALPDIFDVVAAAKDRPGILRDFAVDQRSDAAGKSLEELLARTPNVIVLALRNDRGTFILGPDLSTRLALGDRLMVFGGEEDMQRIQRGFKLADASSGQ